MPARYFGLNNRGRLVVGFNADVVVFDPASIGAGDVELVEDLPGNSARLYSTALGVEKVFVNGHLTVDGGKSTGELPGTILRSGRDTSTVSLSDRNSN